MEVVSTEGRGPNTVYTVREGERVWKIGGKDKLPNDVFQRWRNKQAAECMRRKRARQQREDEASGKPQTDADKDSGLPLTEVRSSQEAGPSKSAQQVEDPVVIAAAKRALNLTTCKICNEEQVQRLIVPCGHLVLCAKCLSVEMTQRSRCPICRADIADHFAVKMIE